MICHTIVEIPNNTGKVKKEVARRSNRNYIGVYERLGLLVNSELTQQDGRGKKTANLV